MKNIREFIQKNGLLNSMSKPLLAINHLSVNFILYTHTTPAIENIHFAVSKGEWVAIVGESGSGKNTFKKKYANYFHRNRYYLF